MKKIGKEQCGRILAGVGLATANTNTIRFLLSAVVVMVLQ